MRFVSKSANYQFVVRADATEWRKDRNGIDTQTTVESHYIAEFKQGWLAPHEKLAAIQHWGGMGNRLDGSLNGFAAHPLMQGTARDAEAFDPRWRLSVFDTEWIADPELRELAERRMTEPGIAGNDYILVEAEKLREPWPGYDTMKGVRGKPLAQQIADVASSTGQLSEALAYEKAVKNREQVVAALEAELKKVVAEWEEDDALSAEVPA
jgi:hypothetical protein